MGVVEEACESFRGGNPLWPLPLIRALDSHGEGLALTWVEACCRVLLALIETDARESLTADLADFASYRTRCASVEEVEARSRHVWYKPPGVDAARRAVSKLYEALACRQTRGIGDYRSTRALAAPIQILLQEVEDPGRALELLLEEFRRLMPEAGVVHG